jgi:predicted dehydrogenase
VAIAVVVAGAGRRGTVWAREIHAHPGYKLAACVDVDPDTLRRSASSLGVPPERRFKELADALDSVDCDAVIVATSEERHVDPCDVALSAGVGVLIEKPFTTRLSEAVGLVELAEERKVPLLVGQQYRYLRFQRAVRRIVSEGRLGRVGMATAHYYHVAEHLTPSQRRMRNSILWGPAVHHIDSLRYVLGRSVTGVMAQVFTSPWGELPNGASMQAMLSFEGGIHAVYSATYESSGHEFFEAGQEYYQRLVGELATLHVFHRWLVLCERGKRPRWIRRGARPVTEEVRLLDQLERALAHGEVPDSSGRANLETIAALEACVRSADEGVWVNPQDLLAEAGVD